MLQIGKDLQKLYPYELGQDDFVRWMEDNPKG
jgi:hypothetical protein